MLPVPPPLTNSSWRDSGDGRDDLGTALARSRARERPLHARGSTALCSALAGDAVADARRCGPRRPSGRPAARRRGPRSRAPAPPPAAACGSASAWRRSSPGRPRSSSRRRSRSRPAPAPRPRPPPPRSGRGARVQSTISDRRGVGIARSSAGELGERRAVGGRVGDDEVVEAVTRPATAVSGSV